jgi:hypothetical protein
MQRSIFPAVLAALVVSVVVNVIVLFVRDDGRGDLLRRAEEAEKRVHGSADKVDTLIGRLDSLERRHAASRRNSDAGSGSDARAAPTEVAPDGMAVFPVDADGAPLAPDGSRFVSLKDLEAEVAKALTARGGTFAMEQLPPEPPKSLEDVAADMGLSAGEVAQLRIILRESEEELLDIFFPGQWIEEAKVTVQQLRDDPDKLSAFMQQGLMRVVSNAGKLLTLERRRNKSIKDLLGEERAQQFRGKRVKPIYGEEIGTVLEDLFKD